MFRYRPFEDFVYFIEIFLSRLAQVTAKAWWKICYRIANFTVYHCKSKFVVNDDFFTIDNGLKWQKNLLLFLDFFDFFSSKLQQFPLKIEFL